MSVEDFLSKLDIKSVQKNQSILAKHEEDIQKLVDKKIKQTIIIEYLFSIDEEIKNKYADEKNIKTLKVIVSTFIKKIKSKKRRKSKDENNIASNSSQSTKKEEPEKNSSDIVPQNSEDIWTNMENFRIKKN